MHIPFKIWSMWRNSARWKQYYKNYSKVLSLWCKDYEIIEERKEENKAKEEMDKALNRVLEAEGMNK